MRSAIPVTAAAVLFLSQSAAAGPGLGIRLPSAAAQDGFQMSGVIDTGLHLQHAYGKDTLSMMPSGDETSEVTLRARESLPGNHYVRVKLTAPYKSDTGEMQQSATNTLFNEGFIAVGGDWGEIAAGRMANIFSGNGDFGLNKQVNPSSMGTNFVNSSLAPIFSSGYYFSNAVVYNSPRLAGFHVALQYSNGKAGEESPRGKTDQLLNVAVTYLVGPWKFGIVAGWYDNDSYRDEATGVTPNDEKNIAVMGSYWPGNGWSFHAAYQYVHDGRALGGSFYSYFTPKAAGGLGISKSKRGVDAHAGILGVGKQFGNQKISAVLMGNYVEYKGESAVEGDCDGWRISPAAIYRYHFSKRTHLWAAVSLTHGTGLYEGARNSAIDPAKSVDYGLGLVHHF